MSNFYETLNLKRDATQQEIKSAFRRLARRYHPDVNPGDKKAEERFKEISQAHEVLGDPNNRSAYDKYGDNWQRANQLEEMEKRNNGFAFNSFSRDSTNHSFSFDGDLSELFGSSNGFESLFRRTSNRSRGADLEQQISITLKEAYSGTTRKITLPQNIQRSSSIEVDIPKGVTSGQRIKITGKGQPGSNGGNAGDLILIINLEPNAVFNRDGHNLHVRSDVIVTDAIFGTEIRVPTLKDKTLVLNLPPMTQSGRIFRLAGQGMPIKEGGFGDLLVEIRIVIPTELSDEQIDLFKKIHELETDFFSDEEK
ncbi:MAG: molecular chaperone DnaJ [Chloroflexi bacterium]|nr:molecular chaperone DnaJ [Chloroflexota bacterium]|tara:strand:- start:10121 stop:11050 length:930 start_codon:yes stop_codon:yes gene_type:complete